MINHRVRVTAWLVALSLLCAVSVSRAQTTAPGPAGPKASEPVQKMLEDARRLADLRQPIDSLKFGDQALALAQQTHDTAGEAFAQQARGKALQDLMRTNEAVTAWQSAADLWTKTGDVPERITSLVQLGLLYPREKKSEAEGLFTQGLSAAKPDASRPMRLGRALHNCAVALRDGGFEDFALDYFSAALTILDKPLPESVQLAETLSTVAKLLLDRGNRNADDQPILLARNYLLRAVEISRGLAPNSSVMVESLHRLGDSEFSLNLNDRTANQHFLAALQIEKERSPQGSAEQVELLRGLGVAELDQGNLTSAYEHMSAAVAMGEELHLKSLDFERALENMAEIEEDEGNLIAARAHMEEAFPIRAQFSDSPARTLINLGGVALYEADFASARNYFEKALDSTKNVNHVTAVIPFALADLSDTYYQQGDLVSAMEYRRRALDYDQRNYPESTALAYDLRGMGDILLAQREFSLANSYYHQSLQIWRKVAPDSLHVADCLSSLASLAREEGDLHQAKQYDLEALALKEKDCPKSPCSSDILNDLGEIAYQQADLKEAENYFRQVVDMREKNLGSTHPDFARSLRNLALAEAALNQKADALDAALRAERIGAEHLRMSIRSLSERQALAYEGVRASGLDVALSLMTGGTTLPSARRQVFDAVVRSRALVLDELATRHRSTYGSNDPEVSRIADELASLRTQLATLVFRGPGNTQPETYRKLLDQVSAKKEHAERLLAEKSASFRQEQARERLGMADVAGSLPDHSALVSYVRYARYVMKDRRAKSPPPPPVPSYGAFILQAGHSEPEFVPLGPANRIEKLISSWRHDVSRESEAAALSTIGGKTSRRSGVALRLAVWDSFANKFSGAAQVFIVPDSALHLVNLAALPVANSRYLLETGPLIHYISTERDLVPVRSQSGKGILVVGNPAFNQAGGKNLASILPSVKTSSTAPLVLRSACGTFKSLHFDPLPASQKEADRVFALWKTSRASQDVNDTTQFMEMTGADASPDAFKQHAPRKRVLHVATHGFFLESGCESAMQLASNPDNKKILPATAENPLLLSGLAFAGANRRMAADESDGILTAEEIAGIDLVGVDWAVLSACDTGVGEIKVGEGVFGLRRAFQVAGAKTVIMSLWPIEDEATQHWMDTLYREHFLRGRTTAEAVRYASLQILRQRRAKHQSTDPFYWGAFIAAGDWH